MRNSSAAFQSCLTDTRKEKTMTRRVRTAAVILTVLLVFLNMGVYFADGSEDVIVPVLMYHNVEPGPDGGDAENISPELFREHMQALLSRGYTPIFVSDYYNCVVRGAELPEKPIAVTFDDGYLSNYEAAFPILKELKIPATIFVVTSTVGLTPESGRVSRPHFTWEQAKEMQESGFVDIYSHSHTHRNMSQLTVAELQTELRLSKYLVEKNLGKNCFIFAYPYGGYSESTFRMAKYAGYRMQILVNDWQGGEYCLANRTSDGLDKFIRLTVSGKMSVEDLYEMLDKAEENTVRNSAVRILQ